MLPMEEQANRMRVVLDNISDRVISVDQSGTITTMNTVAERAFGITMDGVAGKKLHQLDLPGYTLLKCLDKASLVFLNLPKMGPCSLMKLLKYPWVLKLNYYA